MLTTTDHIKLADYVRLWQPTEIVADEVIKECMLPDRVTRENVTQFFRTNYPHIKRKWSPHNKKEK